MPQTQPIEGLPVGAVVRPIQSSAPQIEGLPPGAIVKPLQTVRQDAPKPPASMGITDSNEQARQAILKPINAASPSRNPQAQFEHDHPNANDPARQRYDAGMSMAIPETLLSVGPVGMALAKSPLATAGKILTSTAGSAVGADLARMGTRQFTDDTDVQNLAGYAGGLAGGIAGWREPPARLGWRGFGVEIPDSLRPIGAARDAQEGLGAFMNKGYAPADRATLTQAVKAGNAAKLPLRITKPPAPEPVRPGPVGTLTSPESVAAMPPAQLPQGMPPAPTSRISSTSPVQVQMVDKMAPPAKPAPRLGSTENPGWVAKIPDRMPKPETAPQPEPRLGSPDNPGWVAKLPDRMPKPDMPPANTPKIFTPSDAGPKFTGSEGRAATWTNERVMELAKQGNREAIQQAVRRGFELPPNARYVAGDPSYGTGIYNPRDVTTFAPDGTPIRMQGGPRKPAPTGATIEMPPARTPRIDPVDFSHPSAQQVIAEHAPQLREIATRLQGAEPDIAQHLIDIADGKSVGLEQLQGKIRDPQAAQDYSRLLDNARREARTARTSQVDNQSRGAGSQAERAAQAPELKNKSTLKNLKPHKP